MIFAAYKGNQHHRFIPYKTYLAYPEMGSSDAVDVNHMHITDERGYTHRISADDDCFEFPDMVYAVVVQSNNESFRGESDKLIGEPGRVVSIEDAMEYHRGELLFQLTDAGYHKAEAFHILDRSVVVPGMMVMDGYGKWRKIESVDKSMRLEVEDVSGQWYPSNFMFPVSGGEVAMVQMAKCINGERTPAVRDGRLYQVVSESNHRIRIKNQDAEYHSLSKDRFVIP